jgi:hypothetical protein
MASSLHKVGILALGLTQKFTLGSNKALGQVIGHHLLRSVEVSVVVLADERATSLDILLFSTQLTIFLLK